MLCTPFHNNHIIGRLIIVAPSVYPNIEATIRQNICILFLFTLFALISITNKIKKYTYLRE